MIITKEEKIHDRNEAILEARKIISSPYYIVDTETTGLKNAEMCQFGTLYSSGFEICALIKPSIPIEPGAAAIHHITEEMVAKSPTAEYIVSFLTAEIPIVIYNAKFDLDIIYRSLRAVGVDLYYNFTVYDAMMIYSRFDGEWNDYFGNYKWHKLEEACRRCNIPIDVTLHDALADCKITDKLLHYIAEQKLEVRNE